MIYKFEQVSKSVKSELQLWKIIDTAINFKISAF